LPRTGQSRGTKIPKYLQGVIQATDQDEVEVDRIAVQSGRFYRRLRHEGVPADFAKALVASWYCKKFGGYVPWGSEPDEFEDE
jgi:hypothetical protein